MEELDAIETVEKLLGCWVPAVSWKNHPEFRGFWLGTYRTKYIFRVRENRDSFRGTTRSLIFEWSVQEANKIIANGKQPTEIQAKFRAAQVLGDLLWKT